eukprot:04496_3
MGEALQVLGIFTPKKKVLKVRGMPKQPRESGMKEKMKVSDQKPGSKIRAKKKKKRKVPLTGAPWRWQSKIEDLKGDIGWYKGRQIEVRQRTEEGNHIIRVGYVGSVKSRNADREKAQAKKELQEGLWTREAAIKELQRNGREDAFEQRWHAPWAAREACQASARHAAVQRQHAWHIPLEKSDGAHCSQVPATSEVPYIRHGCLHSLS